MTVWIYRLKGYRLIGRRIRNSAGELDIVMRRGAVLVGIEVKYRHKGTPQEQAVPSARQLARIKRALILQQSRMPASQDDDLRLDIVIWSGWFRMRRYSGC